MRIRTLPAIAALIAGSGGCRQHADESGLVASSSAAASAAPPEKPSAANGSVSLPPPEPDAALAEAIRSIGRDIAGLKPAYPQLAEFDAERNVHAASLLISYNHKTHRATVPGGWRAQVPNPDPDGVWFHIDFHPADSRSQLHTQPFTGRFVFRDQNVSYLMLEGTRTKSLHTAIWNILRQNGVVSLPMSGGVAPLPNYAGR